MDQPIFNIEINIMCEAKCHVQNVRLNLYINWSFLYVFVCVCLPRLMKGMG